MNAPLDAILVAAAILGAFTFFAARFFRRGKKACASGCGCDAAKKPLLPKAR